MAVGKRKRAAFVVAAARQIPPQVQARAFQIDPKAPIADAVLVLIHKHDFLGNRNSGAGNSAHFRNGIKRNRTIVAELGAWMIGRGARHSVHYKINRTGPRLRRGRDRQGRGGDLLRVRRAGIDGHRLVILVKHSLLDIQRRRITLSVAANPGTRIGGGALPRRGYIRRQPIVIIPNIHLVAKLQLLHVAQAFSRLGFGFGGGQRGQQHRRQNRDEGDDHQLFDEREGAAPRLHGTR